ncbi:unnamed protein product, partial [Mesorhabditis spiculigera]
MAASPTMESPVKTVLKLHYERFARDACIRVRNTVDILDERLEVKSAPGLANRLLNAKCCLINQLADLLARAYNIYQKLLDLQPFIRYLAHLRRNIDSAAELVARDCRKRHPDDGKTDTPRVPWTPIFTKSEVYDILEEHGLTFDRINQRKASTTPPLSSSSSSTLLSPETSSYVSAQESTPPPKNNRVKAVKGTFKDPLLAYSPINTSRLNLLLSPPPSPLPDRLVYSPQLLGNVLSPLSVLGRPSLSSIADSPPHPPKPPTPSRSIDSPQPPPPKLNFDIGDEDEESSEG